MSYEQSRSEVQRSHTLSMENRDKLSLTGVEDVSGFDTSSVSIWIPGSSRCAARCRN